MARTKKQGTPLSERPEPPPDDKENEAIQRLRNDMARFTATMFPKPEPLRPVDIGNHLLGNITRMEVARRMADAPDVASLSPEQVFAGAGPYVFAAWSVAGAPVFELSEGLMNALAATEVPDTFDWQLPFPAFAIHLPNPMVTSTMIMVGDLPAPTRSQLALLEPGQFEKFAHMPVDRRVVLAIPEDVRGVWETQVLDPSLQLALILNVPRVDGTLPPNGFHGETLLRLVVNTMKWIESQRRDTDSRAPALPENIRASKTSNHNTYRIGRHIKLSGLAPVGHHIGGSGWKVKGRFMVRGHWRNQAVGKGHSDHRSRWIAPFWKGPHLAGQVLEKTYELADNRGSTTTTTLNSPWKDPPTSSEPRDDGVTPSDQKGRSE